MSGVGLAVLTATGAGGIVAATDGHAQRMEDLQFALGEGPCVDASRLGRPVLVSDLARDAAQRWPAFTPGATDGGVRAAFTFPLQVGAIAIGVLELYRTTVGHLTSSQLTEALAFADAAVAILLDLQDRAGSGENEAAGTDDSGAQRVADTTAPAGVHLDGVVDRRAVVHQAAGMISVQLDVGLPAALLRLRAESFVAGRPVIDVAGDVVARRLRFDHSDVGTSATPPPPPGSSPAEEESS
jgi:hypothetical protein